MSSGPLDGEATAQFGSARITAVELAPYFAPILFAFRPRLTDLIDTMGVNQRLDLFLNASILDRWTQDQLAGVLLHEAHHVLREHFTRWEHLGADSHEALLWNLACDCAINDDLLADRISLPDGAVQPAMLDMEVGCSEEHYFWTMHDRAVDIAGLDVVSIDCHQLPDGLDNGAGASLDADAPDADAGSGVRDRPVVDIEGIRAEVLERIREHLDGRSTAPHGARHARGRLPAGSALLATPEHRRTSWGRRLGARAATAAARGSVELSYRRPRRRDPDGRGLIEPSPVTRPLRIGVLLDTSGSMVELLPSALGELDEIGRFAAELVVLTCDASPGQIQRVARTADIELIGGGGTDLREGLELLWHHRPRLDLVVVLTDGDTPWPDDRPSVPTIVGLIGGHDDSVPSGYEVLVTN